MASEYSSNHAHFKRRGWKFLNNFYKKRFFFVRRYILFILFKISFTKNPFVCIISRLLRFPPEQNNWKNTLKILQQTRSHSFIFLKLHIYCNYCSHVLLVKNWFELKKKLIKKISFSGNTDRRNSSNRANLNVGFILVTFMVCLLFKKFSIWCTNKNWEIHHHNVH